MTNPPMLLSLERAGAMIGCDKAGVIGLWKAGMLRIVQTGPTKNHKQLVPAESVYAYVSLKEKQRATEARLEAPKVDADSMHSKADHAITEAVCYFIGDAAGPVKIGHSKNPRSRIQAFQTGHPYPLALLATRDGGAERERAYHHQFAAHRLHGEWFSRHPDIIAEIDRLNSPSQLSGQLTGDE